MPRRRFRLEANGPLPVCIACDETYIPEMLSPYCPDCREIHEEAKDETADLTVLVADAMAHRPIRFDQTPGRSHGG